LTWKNQDYFGGYEKDQKGDQKGDQKVNQKVNHNKKVDKIKKIVGSFLKPVKGDKNIASDTVAPVKGNNNGNRSIPEVKQPNEVMHDVKLTKKIEDKKTPIQTEIIPDSQPVVEKQSHKNVPKTKNDKKAVHSTKSPSSKGTVMDVPTVDPTVVVSSETKQLKDEKKKIELKKTPKDIKGLKSAQIVEIISQNEVARKTLPEATDANTNTVLQVPMTVPLDKKIETEKRPSERTELGKSKAKKVVKGKDDKKIEAKLNPEEIQSEKTKSEPKKVEKNQTSTKETATTKAFRNKDW